MTPQQALTLLDNVAQAFTGNREDHLKLQQAVAVLNALVNPPKPKKK